MSLMPQSHFTLSLHYLLPMFSGAPVFHEVVSTTTTIDLHWTQNGTSVERYNVSYTYTIRGCGLTSNNTEIGDGTTRSYTLRNLEEGSDYDITLIAIKGRRQARTQIITPTNHTGIYLRRCISSRPILRAEGWGGGGGPEPSLSSNWLIFMLGTPPL